MTRLFSFAVLLVLGTVAAFAQPVIDGTSDDAAYSTTLAYTSGRDGYGNTNNIGYVKFYTDGTDLYFGIESKLETNGNRIVLFLDFSGYNGRAAGNALGTFSGATGIIPASNNTNIRLGMEVDYIFEFNIGGGGGCYFDANRVGTTGFFNTGTYVGSSDLSGTAVTPTGLNTNVFSTTSPGVTFAYNNGGGAGQGLELKIPIASLPGVSNTQSMQLLAILANNGNPTHFSNECVPGDPGSSNPGTNPDLTSLTGSSEINLPVELTSFKAAVVNGAVRLDWSTATEKNNAGFTVERRTGSAWTVVGTVAGHGTTNAAQQYQFTDRTASIGTYTYRLKQTDHDGKFTYSPEVEAVIALAPGTTELSQNYPNPFNPVTAISFTVAERQQVRLAVYDLIGREVSVLVNGVVEPNVRHSVPFNASALGSGVYLYKLTTASATVVRKMTVLK